MFDSKTRTANDHLNNFHPGIDDDGDCSDYDVHSDDDSDSSTWGNNDKKSSSTIKRVSMTFRKTVCRTTGRLASTRHPEGGLVRKT